MFDPAIKNKEARLKGKCPSQDIRCVKHHKVAELIGEEIYIKCKSCGHFVRVTFKDIHREANKN